jgi:hypothetical protein
MRHATSAERDAAEEEFFAQGIWASLNPLHAGVKSLRPRLSNVLKDQILLQLPDLLQDVQNGIDECRDRLGRLGEARGTTKEQRRCLGRISQQFSVLMGAAVDGTYRDPFFGNSNTVTGQRKRLRAVVQNSLSKFAEVMHTQGQRKKIVDGPLNKPDSRLITRSNFIDEVKALMRRNRGCELPGTFNPLIIGDLFTDQCQPWKGLVKDLIAKILEASFATINALLKHLTIEEIADGLRREAINPGMETLKANLDMEVDNVLEPHYSNHPITYSHYLTDNVQKAHLGRRRDAIGKTLREVFPMTQGGSRTLYPNELIGLQNRLTQDVEADMERYASSMVIDYMEAYYKVVYTSSCTTPSISH